MDPRSMDYPRGPPLIFEDEFYQRSKQILGILNGRNWGQVLFVNLRNRTGKERKRQTLCAKRDNNFVWNNFSPTLLSIKRFFL